MAIRTVGELKQLVWVRPVGCFGSDDSPHMIRICAQQPRSGGYEGNCQFQIGKQPSSSTYRQ